MKGGAETILSQGKVQWLFFGGCPGCFLGCIPGRFVLQPPGLLNIYMHSLQVHFISHSSNCTHPYLGAVSATSVFHHQAAPLEHSEIKYIPRSSEMRWDEPVQLLLWFCVPPDSKWQLSNYNTVLQLASPVFLLRCSLYHVFWKPESCLAILILHSWKKMHAFTQSQTIQEIQAYTHQHFVAFSSKLITSINLVLISLEVSGCSFHGQYPLFIMLLHCWLSVFSTLAK